MMRGEDAGRDVVSFFAGALLGAGLALLFAPKTGREVRESVTGFTNDAMSKMKDFGTEAQEKMRTSFERGKEMVKEKTSGFSFGKNEPEKEATLH